MEMNIEYNKVKYPIHVSGWNHTIGGDLVSNMVLMVWIKAKNGKKFAAQHAYFMMLNGVELSYLSSKNLNDVKEIKLYHGKQYFIDILKQIVGKRMGFPGMRGNFRVMEVLPYDTSAQSIG